MSLEDLEKKDIWEDTSEFRNTKRAEKVKEKKIEVKYKIFYNAAIRCNEEYWKDFFLNASKDKFPSGFSYKNNHLIYKRGKKEVKMDLTEYLENDENIWRTLMNFIIRYGNHKSENDIKEKEEKEQLLLSRDKDETVDIRKKKQKDILISNYLNDLKKENNLTKKEFKDLETLINYNLGEKKIQTTDFIIEDSKLINIKNLFFNEEERNFEIKSKKISSKKKITGVCFSDEEIIDFLNNDNFSTESKDNVNIKELLKNSIQNIFNIKTKKRNKLSESFTLETFNSTI